MQLSSDDILDALFGRNRMPCMLRFDHSINWGGRLIHQVGPFLSKSDALWWLHDHTKELAKLDIRRTQTRV